MLEMFLPSKKDYRTWAPFFLRLAIGIGFIVHRWAKISRGPAGLQKLLLSIDVPFAHVTAYVLPYVELLGGLFILVGIFVSIVSLPLIAIMAVAMFTIHIRFGFSSVNTVGLTPQGPLFGPPGYEINLIYISLV